MAMHLSIVLAQPFTAAGQAGLDRRDRAVLEVGDLLDGKAIQLEEDQRLPLNRGQAGERPGRPLRAAPVFGLLARIHALRVETLLPLPVQGEEAPPEVAAAAVGERTEERRRTRESGSSRRVCS
jgi:hypothetical protein